MSDSQTPLVVFLSGDLMFASRVRGAAESAGMRFYVGGNVPEEESTSIEHVILDLATRSSLTESIVATCARLCPQASLIAYGPHVQVTKLDAAKQAGIPVVMTRGQFDKRLVNMFTTQP